jgi:hypothetical protein
VNHAIRSLDVSGNDVGRIVHDNAIANDDCDGGTLDSGNVTSGDISGKHGAADDVVGEDLDQGGTIFFLQQGVNQASRKSCESVIVGSENSKWSSTLKGLNQTSGGGCRK